MAFIQRFKWIPSTVIMGVIFYLSAQTSYDLPNYGHWDYIIKKTGHIFGYLLLSIFNHYWLNGKKLTAILMALLFAISDEVHQTFTEGRSASWIDVAIFDLFGIVLGSFLYQRISDLIQTRVRIPHP